MTKLKLWKWAFVNTGNACFLHCF